MSVFHLKYRPVLISDLDSVQAAERLRKILSNKDSLQSFLFAGPKGSGKTSAARILARTINCVDLKNGEACGKCDNCKEILGGNSIDIIEIDAASNRGIDDVRSLKERAYLLPSKLKIKVFIIDEVHMLTKDAFNALLKLIEEPPKHTVFILCTTDPEKIPETVLSRLTRVEFRKGNKTELRGSLDKIVKGEKIDLEEKAATFLIDRSDGSFRNLQRNFNEIFLHFGKKIDFSNVEEFFLMKSGSYLEADFEMDLNNGKTKDVLEKLERMADEGVDFSGFRQKLLDFFQKKLLINFGVEEGERSLLNFEELEFLINLLIKAAGQEKEVEIEQLPLELVVIDFISSKRLESKNEVEIDKDKKKVSFAEASEDLKKKSNEKEERVDDVVVEVNSSGVSLEKIQEEWGNILLAVKPFNHSVEAFLRATRPMKCDGRTLVLEVFYPFHKDRLEEDKNRKIVESGLKQILGVELIVSCILGKNKGRALVIKNTTPIENINEELAGEKGSKKGQDLYDVAKEIFG